MNDRFHRLELVIERIRERHAPDPRTSVFEIRYDCRGDVLRLAGAATEHAALDELVREAAALEGWNLVEDQVRRLPERLDGEPAHGIVTAAMVPLLAGPLVTETHVSQEVLGRRLTILQRTGRWYQCRTDDGYVGWAHRGYFVPANESEARSWDLGSDGEPCISLGAEVRAEDGSTVARLPWGARFALGVDGRARLPDGRCGALAGDVVPVTERARRFPRDAAAIVATATLWTGAPYLWGGVTPAGVDCSGLVQAVFRIHGIELPRDSDQQAGAGEPVSPHPDFANVKPGDLLFFAERGEVISHVVISAGGPEIVHASLGNGGVARNDLLGNHPYERELRTLFVCARRYL